MRLILKFVAGLVLGGGATLSTAATAPVQVDPLCGCVGPLTKSGWPSWPLPSRSGVTGGASYTSSCFQVAGSNNCRITGTLTHTADPNPQSGMSGYWKPDGSTQDPPHFGPGAMPYVTGSWPMGPNTDTWGGCGSPGPKNPVWMTIWYMIGGTGPYPHSAADDWRCDAQ
jgi:hypothetical protein